MKAPISWLKDYVDIDVSNQALAGRLTLSGSKVETITDLYGDISKVVVGKIISLKKHPDAEKLQVSMVDIGNEQIQIVTGAQNVKVGDLIPVALVGARLPGDKSISKGKLRGVESCGMMCSISELNLTKEDYPHADEDGIFILDQEFPLGSDIKEALRMDETIIEFEITPNRPDCLSIEGLGREIAVTLGKPFKKKLFTYPCIQEKSEDSVSVEIQDPLCKRYIAKVIKNVKIQESPKWLQARLKAAGIRSINNFVDITNYVMLELGQPMHAFDLHILKGRKIIVRSAHDQELIVTLDEQERKLEQGMLVIADEKDPVAVAGVMGGQDSKIEAHTHTILFESASFDGASVRTTSKKLGLRTDSSARFEKGLDPENAIRAIELACHLVEQFGIGDICEGLVEAYPVKPVPREIPFQPEEINRFLGTDIESSEMMRTLSSLEFQFNATHDVVKPPSFRNDVSLMQDLAEEIARFFDYNHITPTLLSGKTAMQGKRTYGQKIQALTKNTVVSCGYSEAFNYSFYSPKIFDKLQLSQDSIERNAVVISNPLGEDFSIMRTTPIPSILTSLSNNFNRRNERAELFEMAKVFLPQEGEVLPLEKVILTLGSFGAGDFYDLKAVIEEIFSVLGIKHYAFTPENDHPAFHPGRTANILIGKQALGIIGEIHPQVAENFESAPRTYVATLDMQELETHANLGLKYKQLPKFPAVQRDLALLVADQILVKQIEDIIKKKSSGLIEEVKLFDVYKGKQIPEHQKSVAFSLTFRAKDKTLTEEEVNSVMQTLLAALKKQLGAELRLA